MWIQEGIFTSLKYPYFIFILGIMFERMVITATILKQRIAVLFRVYEKTKWSTSIPINSITFFEKNRSYLIYFKLKSHQLIVQLHISESYESRDSFSDFRRRFVSLSPNNSFKMHHYQSESLINITYSSFPSTFF